MIEKRILSWLTEDKIPHALLFVGDKQTSTSCASDFAWKIVLEEKKENHPDIHHYFPEGKTGMHALSSLRSLLNDVYLTSYGKGKKCFIIHDAERMLPTSANALLKVIEEPPPKTHFFLLTPQKEKLLPTLLSRCQILFFPEQRFKERSLLQEKFFSVLLGSEDLETIVKMLESGKKEREKHLLSELPQDITPAQREVYEKEIEGTLAMQNQEEFSSILEILLDWYRDLVVCEHGLPRSYLRFDRSVACSRFPSWRQVEIAIRQGREAIERNIPIRTILESLLVRLGCLRLKSQTTLDLLC